MRAGKGGGRRALALLFIPHCPRPPRCVPASIRFALLVGRTRPLSGNVTCCLYLCLRVAVQRALEALIDGLEQEKKARSPGDTGESERSDRRRLGSVYSLLVLAAVDFVLEALRRANKRCRCVTGKDEEAMPPEDASSAPTSSVSFARTSSGFGMRMSTKGVVTGYTSGESAAAMAGLPLGSTVRWAHAVLWRSSPAPETNSLRAWGRTRQPQGAWCLVLAWSVESVVTKTNGASIVATVASRNPLMAVMA